MSEAAATADGLILDDGVAFGRRRRRLPSEAAGAEIVAEIPSPAVPPDLAARVLLDDAAERAAIAGISTLLRETPFRPSAYRLVRLPDAVVLNFPRAEGLVLDARGDFVHTTRGSPAAFPDTPFLRIPRKGDLHFRLELPLAGTLDRAFLPFCPAIANFAHFIGLCLPRIALARERLADMPFLFPDLPRYRDYYPTAMRNEFFFRLPELMPLGRGNFHRPLPEGAFRLRELVLVEPVDLAANRWDMAFQPEVRAAFAAIAAEAPRRARLAGALGVLPARLHVSRQAATRRRIVNEDAVGAVLAEEGFAAVRMETLDLWDQVALIAAAREVVAVHGAGCAGIVFARPGVSLVELYPRPLLSVQFLHGAVGAGGVHVPLPCGKVNRRLDLEADPVALRAAIRAARAAAGR